MLAEPAPGALLLRGNIGAEARFTLTGSLAWVARVGGSYVHDAPGDSYGLELNYRS